MADISDGESKPAGPAVIEPPDYHYPCSRHVVSDNEVLWRVNFGHNQSASRVDVSGHILTRHITEKFKDAIGKTTDAVPPKRPIVHPNMVIEDHERRAIDDRIFVSRLH